MDGTLGVHSEPGHGSTFWFTMPFAIAADAPDAPDALKVRALVVERDPAAADVIGRYLREWGASALVERDPQVAHSLLREACSGAQPFDVVIASAAVLGERAPAFARELRADPRLAKTPRILMGDGPANTDEREELHDYDGFISTPLHASQLYDCLVTLTRGGASYVAQSLDPVPTDQARIPALGAGIRVLVVEDNVVNQQIAAEQLKKLGVDVSIAENGRVAVELVLHEEYRAVLMDCQMPVMDGFEATRAIREAESLTNRHTPIIAMTANARAEDRQLCLRAGMDDYISKPVRLADLRSVLERWLGQTSAQPAAHLSADDAPIDMARLRELFGSNTAAINRVVDLALQSARKVSADLQQAYQRDGASACAPLAHQLRGSCLNAGLAQIAVVAGAIEDALAGGRSAELSALFAQLDDCCQLAAEHRNVIFMANV